MTLTGQSLVAGQWIGDSANGEFHAFSPARNEALPTRFFNLSTAELNGAIEAAQSAFYQYRKTSFAQRADF